MALALNERVIPAQTEYRDRNVDIKQLINSDKTGTMQLLKPLDDRIFDETHMRHREWTVKKNAKDGIQNFYRWMDETILKEYQRPFGV